MSNMRAKERDGFSLVELVVAIGILFILTTVTATTVYKDFKDKRISEAVQVATEAAYATALNELNDFDEDNDGRTEVQNVINEKIGTKNKSGENDKINFQVVLQSGLTDDDFNKDNLCVQGKWKENSKFTSNVGNCNEQQKANPDPVLPKDPEILDTITKMTYQCDVDSSGPIAIVDPNESTRVTQDDGNGNVKEIKYNSSGVKKGFYTSLKANVKYTIIVDGKFETLKSDNLNKVTDCLISIDKMGEDSEIKNINMLQGKKLESVPTSIPKSVTSLKSAFQGSVNFNSPNVKTWDVSNVIDMSNMFYNAGKFNQDLNGWGNTTKNVTNMSNMFNNADSFNGDMNNWDTSKVTNMSGMFAQAASFNSDISSWNVSNVTNMSSMFAGENDPELSSFNQDLSNWNVSKVQDMSTMFLRAGNFNSPLNWGKNTKNVTSMSNMFNNAEKFNQDLSDWDVTNVESMHGMFRFAHNFNSPLKWGSKVRNVKDMSLMFDNETSSDPTANPSKFNQDLSGWKPTSVENMHGMFRNASSFNNGGAAFGSNWRDNLSNVTSMTYMFKDASSFSKLIDWKTSNLRYTDGMFSGATSFKGVVNTLDVSNVTHMQYMFSGATSFNNTVQYWDTSKVTNMQGMFQGATSFNMFVYNWDVSNVTDMSFMFRDATSFNNNNNKDDAKMLGNWKTYNVTNMQGMFDGATSFNQNISNWNVSKVVDTSRMFYKAESFNSPLTWDYKVRNITNMQEMFGYANAFNQDLSNWNVGKVTNMKGMFKYAKSYNNGLDSGVNGQTLDNWKYKVSSVTDTSSMFENAYAFNQNINVWRLTSVTDMSKMFKNAWEFNGLVSSTTFNSNALTNTSEMFSGAKKFNRSLSSIDTSNITNMNRMFYYAVSFNQNISGWDVEKVSDYSEFRTGSDLTTANTPSKFTRIVF